MRYKHKDKVEISLCIPKQNPWVFRLFQLNSLNSHTPCNLMTSAPERLLESPANSYPLVNIAPCWIILWTMLLSECPFLEASGFLLLWQLVFSLPSIHPELGEHASEHNLFIIACDRRRTEARPDQEGTESVWFFLHNKNSSKHGEMLSL